MDSRVIIGFIAAVLAILALPVLAASDPAAVAQRIQAAHTAPGYATLGTATKTLAVSVKEVCAAEGRNQDAVRDAFNGAMDAWQSVQHIRNGAITAFDQHARLQFWPDKRGKVGKQLGQLIRAGDAQVLSAIDKQSVAVQGFPALERLIFDGDGLTLAKENGAAFSRCDVATAIATNVAEIGADLAAAPARSGPPAETVRAYMTDLVTGFESISRLKLDGPIGKKRARGKFSESWRSRRSLHNIALNLDALSLLYGILMGTAIQDDDVLRDIAVLRSEVAQNGRSLFARLEDDNGRGWAQTVSARVQAIRTRVAERITAHLGLNLGFNSLDGD